MLQFNYNVVAGKLSGRNSNKYFRARLALLVNFTLFSI
jgi:hypothetical protein